LRHTKTNVAEEPPVLRLRLLEPALLGVLRGSSSADSAIKSFETLRSPRTAAETAENNRL
jgi:hypothetical protein